MSLVLGHPAFPWKMMPLLDPGFCWGVFSLRLSHFPCLRPINPYYLPLHHMEFHPDYSANTAEDGPSRQAWVYSKAQTGPLVAGRTLAEIICHLCLQSAEAVRGIWGASRNHCLASLHVPVTGQSRIGENHLSLPVPPSTGTGVGARAL